MTVLLSDLQILTQEDWNAVLYNGMASTSPLAALYFVALMTFGNYVLFNLLVAILVEGFQAEVRAKMTLNLSYLENTTQELILMELGCAVDTQAVWCRLNLVWFPLFTSISTAFTHLFSLLVPCICGSP